MATLRTLSDGSLFPIPARLLVGRSPSAALRLDDSRVSGEHAVLQWRRGRWEICWRGRKLIGSAQVRRRDRFLQHGSIPIRIDRNRLCAALGVPPDPDLPAVGIAAAAPEPVSHRRLIDALVGGFEREFEVSLIPDRLSADEIGIVRARVRP